MWLLAVPFFLGAHPTTRLLVVGAVLATAGIVIRAWAAGTIEKELELATTGPYAYTRNPLYLGTLLIGLGVTVGGGRWEFALLFSFFFVFVYGRTIRREMDRLAERFGDPYAAYASQVPLFVPRAVPFRAIPSPEQLSAHEGFTLARWLRNREYEALLGVVATFLFLAVKLFWM
jgi:protein-S-isoprenylcysteine O-methyltransferase Ste14